MNPASTETIRTFIAIDLPVELKREIAGIQKRLRPFFDKARVSWVRLDNMHLTLRFIGDVPANDISTIIRAGEMLRCIPAFEIYMNGMGFFPNVRKPRVLWCGYDDSTSLTGTQALVEKTVAQSGFPAEEKPFVPHITLARIKELQTKPGSPFFVDMNAAQKEIDSIRLFFTHTVNSIRLIKSRLSPKGSDYTVLHEWRLKV